MRWLAVPYLRTLRFRLLLLIGLALLPITALVLYNAAEERETTRRTTEERALPTTQRAASEYAVYVAATDDLLERIAAQVRPLLADTAQCDAYLHALVEAAPFYANIFVANTGGMVMCSATPHDQRIHVSQKEVLQRALQSGTPAIGTFHFDGAGRPIPPFSYPIGDSPNGPHVGMVVDIDVVAASYSLGIEQLPSGAVATLLDANGTVVLHYPIAEMWTGQSIGDARLLDAARARTPVVLEATDVDGVRRLSGIYPLGPPWNEGTVIVGIATGLAYAPANSRLVRSMASLAIAPR
jgi:hypothetical protein